MKASPWSSWVEWARVLELLKSETQKRQGLDIIHMWQSRGKVPASVSSTAAIVEAMLMDPKCNPTANTSTFCLQLIYAMAIVRTVNTIVDSQQKSELATSV